jgi:2-phospho-L-lactate guanylyltransferase (CobY/MobA/RfbA family)
MRHLVLVILCGCHSHRITSTKCRVNTVVSPDEGQIVARNMLRKEINVLRKFVHQVDFIYKLSVTVNVHRPGDVPC